MQSACTAKGTGGGHLYGNVWQLADMPNWSRLGNGGLR